MAQPRGDRSFDIVLLGATGFAGKLTAAYLAGTVPDGCRWALAGRSIAKLEAVRADLAAHHPHRPQPELVTADITEQPSLVELAHSTRVLVTTVGPYALYGDGVVGACAEAGTDYLDLTGEPEFVDMTYVRHHKTALRTGARLVHAAGFDSVPHDLGTLFTVQQLAEGAPITVSGYVRANAAFSGGTFASTLTAFSRARQMQAAARARRNLEPHDTTTRDVRSVAGRPHRDTVSGGWALPLPTIDPQIVARSARTLERYGPHFRYSHYVSLPRLVMAVGGVAGLGALAAAAQIGPARRALQRRLEPGDGPSADKRARSWFRVTFVGNSQGTRVVTRVSGGDPGYDETAKMLGESALCLAYDDLPATSGQVTTAVAMGDALISRLRAAGMTFEIIG